jgi:hypothetical protein
MGQIRVQEGEPVRVETEEVGWKLFNLKVPPEFYEQLEAIIGKWPGRWSMAAVIRKLVAEAAGAEFLEEAATPSEPGIKPAYRKSHLKRRGLLVKPEESRPPKEVEVGALLLSEATVERLRKYPQFAALMEQGILGPRTTEEAAEGMMAHWDKINAGRGR